jgi:hypothetical protein
MKRDEVETGLKDAIVEALLDLVGKPLTEEVVQEILQRSEWAKTTFAAANQLEVEVVETEMGPQLKFVVE